MNPNTDKITIYVITKPAYVEGYTVDTGKNLCTNFNEAIGDMPMQNYALQLSKVIGKLNYNNLKL